MYIKHSTKVPVQLSDKLIKKVLKNHRMIIKKIHKLDNIPVKFTQSSTIPEW